MKLDDKILLFEQLKNSHTVSPSLFYEVLEKCDAIKANYREYMTTAPIDCDTELRRLHSADYDLCCALLTMLLREDHFSNGRFEQRQRSGQVQPIIERILTLLTANNTAHIDSFSEKALAALNGFYVYALIDPRSNRIFYIGKGTGNRVFPTKRKAENFQNLKRKSCRRSKKLKTADFS